MPIVLDEDDPEVRAGLAEIRVELDLPGPHSPAALVEAEASAARVLGGLDADVGRGRIDARHHAFVTVDPEGSRDLDQAVCLERLPGGFVVRYAIADVAAFVAPGSVVDQEAWQRGVTYYLPDGRAPLHPTVLSEGAASLGPGVDRPAVLWTIELDGDGQAGATRFERAVVRSRAQLTYTDVQGAVDAGTAEGTVALLAEIGPLRLAIEAERGGVSLDLPTQRVVRADGTYRLEREAVVPAMGWNAQISLLAGMQAAQTMQRHGIGLLRTLPPPPDEVVRTVRRTAKALGVSWPDQRGYAAEVRSLRNEIPEEAALLALAARGLRGAGYCALLPDRPAPKGRVAEHAAVAAPYAHVTAPLRRLADRFANEVCLALFAGEAPPAQVVEVLDDLPKAMARAQPHAHRCSGG